MENTKLRPAEKVLLKYEIEFHIRVSQLSHEEAEKKAMDKIMRVRKISEDLRKEGFAH